MVPVRPRVTFQLLGESGFGDLAHRMAPIK
jgi:hypothetical protein